MKISKVFKIGLFTVLCIAAFVWGINFLKGRNLFTSSNVYYAVFDQVDGLVESNKVMLSGYKVGVVQDIKFEEDYTGRLIVSMLIEKDYKIPQKSIAKLVSTDIMGGKAIKLEVNRSKTFYEPGDTLVSAIETGLIDQLAYQMVPVKQKAEALMEELEKSLEVITLVFNETNRENLNNSFVSLRRTLYNLDRSSAMLDTMLNSKSGSIRQIMANASSISNNLRLNNDKISNTIKNFSSISDSLAKVNFASTILKADSAMSSLNTILTSINQGQGTLGQLAKNDTLYYNLESASRNLELLLVDMKENPKRYINVSVFDFSKTRYVETKKTTAEKPK
jgi:phospholipid/cholesterol/gamma-HCH transport system substrate-binding protein